MRHIAIMRKDQPITLFMHLPRAGGTSLSSVVWRQFGDAAFYDVYGLDPRDRIKELFAMPREDRDHIACVSGHFMYGAHEAFDRTPRYITMLRDPVERLISSFHYMQTKPKNWLYQEIVGGKMTLWDFARSNGMVKYEVRNLQTRLLAAVQPPEEVGEQHGDLALERLRKSFALVGVTERFDDFLLTARKLFGWQHILYYRKNAGKTKPPPEVIEPELREELRDLNRQDQRLYDEARRLFDQKFSATICCPDVQRRLLGMGNKIYSTYWSMRGKRF